jgi:hypothetical protein
MRDWNVACAGRATSGVNYVTDSAGLVAFDDAGLMNQRVFFSVKSHGYEFRNDGFGIRGVALDVKPGGSAQLKIKRLNIAERLYRVTGEGIYRDSVLLGRQPPIREPLLNAQVTGCDSVVTAAYRGKLYWFWGDTNQVAYLLGNYNVPGATSRLDFDVTKGVDLDYFIGEKGFAKAVCKMPGDGPTWIGGLAALPDAMAASGLCGLSKSKPDDCLSAGIAVGTTRRTNLIASAILSRTCRSFPMAIRFAIETARRVFCTSHPTRRWSASGRLPRRIRTWLSMRRSLASSPVRRSKSPKSTATTPAARGTPGRKAHPRSAQASKPS